jgi:hypothetical protein
MGKDWERNAAGNGTGNGENGLDYIATYDLQAYVPIPTAGAVPVKNIENNRNITITAVWKDETGNGLPESFNAFVRGAVYQADITLSTKNGYVFDPEISFRYPEGMVDRQPEDDFSGETRALSTVTYKPTEEPVYISAVDLTFYIPLPFMGGTPVTNFYSGTYGGMVGWKIGDTTLAGLFQGRTVYKADASLYAGPGYVFSPDVQVLYQWEHISDTFAYDGGKVLWSIIFPETAETAPGIGDYDVKDYDLQHYVPVPVAGGVPVTELSRPDMEVTVRWQDRNGADIPGSFVQGARYLAIITMKTREPYKFSAAYPFMYPDGAVAIQPAPGVLDTRERVLSVTYHETLAPLSISPSTQDLAFYIAPPGTGATAILSFAGTGYTGTAEWQVLGPGSAWAAMPEAQFKPGAAYRTEVTLYPAAGYILDGAEFIHSGGTVGSSGTLTGSVRTGMIISFPVTAIEAVNDFNLTSKVPQPVMSGTPVGYFSAPQYTGTADWKVTGGGAAGGLFAADTAYTGTVSLTAVSGYTFTGAAVAFTHAGALKKTGGAPDVQVLYNTGDTVTVIIGFPETGKVPPVPLTDLDLTEKVPRPVRGGTPVGYFSAPEYTGTAAWTQTDGDVPVNGGLFAASTAYTAKVSLTAASGWTFTGVNVKYKDAEVTVSDNSGAAITVTIAFDATGLVPAVPVTDLNLTAMVPKPVMSGVPSGWFSAARYSGAAVWTETNGGAAVGGLFAADTAYTATVTLAAASGWTLGSPPPSFTHDDKTSVVSAAHDNGNGTMTVTITFEATGTVDPVPVDEDDLDLTYMVPTPVRGGTPVGWFSAPQYTGSVKWTQTASGAEVKDLFQAGINYTAAVTLLAASDRIFDGGNVRHGGALPDGVTADTTNPSSTITVTIDFPKTTTVQAVPVDDLDLTSNVPAPVMSGVPVVWFSAPQYTGNVTWKTGDTEVEVNGLFAAGTVYKAVVSLTAASGWKFPGISSFATHDGASGVTTESIEGGIMTVTVTFPATGSVPASLVTELDLTDMVPRPVRDGTPLRYLTETQYTGTVNWTVTGGAAVDGLFEVDTYYTAVVRLTAASGWVFGDIDKLSFGHNKASPGGVSSPEESLGSVTVTIDFPKTSRNIPIDKVNLKNLISRPVTGGTPGTSFSEGTYSGTLVWTKTVDGNPLSGLFQTGTAYTATAVLTAASGYAFTGEDTTFSYGDVGLNAVNNPGGGVTIIINFLEIGRVDPGTGVVW